MLASMDSAPGYGHKTCLEHTASPLILRLVLYGSIHITGTTLALLGTAISFSHIVPQFTSLCFRGGMKESGVGRENGLEAYEACEFFRHHHQH